MDVVGGLGLTTLYFSSEILFWTFDLFDFNIKRGPFYTIKSSDIKFSCNRSKLLRNSPETKGVYKIIVQRISDTKIKS